MAIGFGGLTPVNPNEARALVLFGRYDGTIREQGLHWVNPLTERRRISVKVRNFETSRLKVNDHDGNPIEIAAVVVWKVTDTAEALFEVDDFENFVHVQAESALRNMATVHPYDAHIEGDISLRSNPMEIADQLREQIQDRLERAGVQVIEARISHLAYAPEIANAMLRRQQANAVIAARTRIVEGAVGMVEMALEQLSSQGRRRARQRTQGDDGQQPARGPVLRARDPAGRQHGDPVRLIGRDPCPIASPSSCASTRRRSRPCSAGPPMTCAASTARSSSCSGAP